MGKHAHRYNPPPPTPPKKKTQVKVVTVELLFMSKSKLSKDILSNAYLARFRAKCWSFYRFFQDAAQHFPALQQQWSIV